MVIDSSAIIAILLGEAEAGPIIDALTDAEYVFVSAATIVEINVVQCLKNGEAGLDELDSLLAELRPDIIPVTARQARIAREAFRQYGRGRHPARLNFGDCFSYALAKDTGQPLLFKGNDFSRTDLEAVSY